LAADNYAPKTLGQLAAHSKLSSLPVPALIQAALVLTGAGYAHPAQEPTSQAKLRCAAMNLYLCERARSSASVLCLASPVCAVGVPVGQFQQLFLLAAHHGRRALKDQAAFVWDLLAAQGQRIVKEGKTLDTPEQNLDELLKQVPEFTDKRLPVLNGLGVALH
jgi:hypothetical protein